MPDLRFAAPKEQRVAVVTGGASGIGAACVVRFAEEGRDVVIADLNERGAEVAAQVEGVACRAAGGPGPRALFVPTDVTSEAAVKAMVAKALDSFGRLDIL